MRYRDTITKLSFALVFVYLAFDIKIGGGFYYFDSSCFKLIASFMLMYFGLRSNRTGDDPSCGSRSLVSLVFGIFGHQFNFESGYDYYYFSPSRFSSSIEYSTIISGILGFKLIFNTYFSDFYWYLNSISISGFAEIFYLVFLCSSLNIYIQTFGKLRLHDFMYQIYYMQNTGGAWASVYLCQLQSIGYVLSLAVYVSEFLDSLSQEILDLSLYCTNYSANILYTSLYTKPQIIMQIIITYSSYINQQIYIIYSQTCNYIYSLNLELKNNLEILRNYIAINFNYLHEQDNLQSNLLSNLSYSRSKPERNFEQTKSNQTKTYNLISLEVLVVRSIAVSTRYFLSNIKSSRVTNFLSGDNIAYGKSHFNYNLTPILRC